MKQDNGISAVHLKDLTKAVVKHIYIFNTDQIPHFMSSCKSLSQAYVMTAYSELVLILRLISLGRGMWSLSAEREDCS